MSNFDPMGQNKTLSPSELVLLNGEKFAKKVMIGNFKLMHTEASVSFSQLAEAMLAAAALSVESSGNLEYEVRSEKAMFGLRKVQALYATPTSKDNPWPEHSLESQLIKIATRFESEGESSRISDLVYAWLRQDSASPWQSSIEMVQAGLAERGLLEATESTKLKVFTTTSYSLPESTTALASQSPIEPVQNLLSTTEKNNKDFWELLIKEIKRAIKQRTEQDDVDFD